MSLDGSQQTNSNSQQSSQQQADAANQFEGRMDRLLTAANVQTPAEFAKILGIKQQSVSSAKARKQLPYAWVVEISERFAISADWILFGTGSMRRDEPQPGGPPPEACLSPGDFVLLPLLKSRVAAGPEGEILYEEVGDYYPFKRWWIEKISGRSEERRKCLVLVKVRGDSMSPTINQGEIILVDIWETERLEIRTGQIYLINMPDGSSAIKRLAISEAKDGRVKLICMSDNVAAYQPFEFDLDPSRSLKHYVLGRVRWAGKQFD